jgi:hypothetical protein
MDEKVIDLSKIKPPYRVPVNSPFGPEDDVHPGKCDCERCRAQDSASEKP